MENIKFEEYKYDVNCISSNINDYYILSRCLNIANSDKLVTNMSEMMKEIFDNRKKIIVKNDKNKIIAYCIYDNKHINDMDVVHLYDLKVHKEEQNRGIGKEVLLNIVNNENPSLLISKTYNPRAYRIMKNLFGRNTISYSNSENLPEEIKKVVDEDDYFDCDDDFNFQLEGDKKIKQFVYDYDIRHIFNELPDNCSKGIIVVNNKELLNNKEITNNKKIVLKKEN